jgi:ribose 5-phosphate isomerase B
MKLFVAADHRGFELKDAVLAYLTKQGHDAVDSGDVQFDPEDDFPVYAVKAAHEVLRHDNSRAILICGSGQGMVMAANRIKGIRAGLGWSRQAAQGIRNDEDSNVLALPAELYDTDKKLVFSIIDDFIQTPFANAPRYIRRNKELDSL